MVKAIEDVLAQVLDTIKPSKQTKTEVTEQINRFVNDLNTLLQKNHLSAHAMLGGSFAKGTWLVDEFDVDIFVQFEDPTTNMSDTLEKILPPNAVRVHGSRDYFQITDANVQYEIVPVLKITDANEADNVTDVSPLHVTWVRKADGLQDDIRLAKQFLKSHRLYGAESYLQGFSGHVVDILLIHYGGFENFLKSVSKWTDKTVLDPEKHYKQHVLHHLNTSKTQGPLVIVDPLDKTRNAAAAVGVDAYESIKIAAEQFLRKPSAEAFTQKAFHADKNTSPILIRIELLEGKRDIRGNKLVKIYGCIERSLTEFGVRESNWEWNGKDEAYLWYNVEHTTLSTTKEQPGPPADLEHAAKAFRAQHKTVFERDNRLYATVERRHTKVFDALTNILASPYVTERCAKVEIIRPKAQ